VTAGWQPVNPAVTDTVNNGINEFIFVLRRDTYLMPPGPSVPSRYCPGVT
jgi:hypothetical protein